MCMKEDVSLSPSHSVSTDASTERKLIKITNRMSVYVFTESDADLLIKGSINSLSINGNNNRILIRSSVPTLIINGEGNVIKSTYYKNSLCDIIFNNDNNKIKIAKGSSYINKIDNGNNNKIYSEKKEPKEEKEEKKEECDKKEQNINSNCNIKISFSINYDEIVSLFSNKKRNREDEYY